MELGDLVGVRKAENRFDASLVSKLGIHARFEDLPKLEQAKNEFKNYLIDHTLAENGYNVSETARTLGIDRKTIQRRITKNNYSKSIKFYTGKEAVKDAIYSVLNKYLPETQADKNLLENKATEFSKLFEGYKLSLDTATKVFESYLVNVAIEITKDKKEAAERLGVSERTVERKLNSGNLYRNN